MEIINREGLLLKGNELQIVSFDTEATERTTVKAALQLTGAPSPSPCFDAALL